MTTANTLVKHASEVKQTFGWVVQQYRLAKGWGYPELEHKSGVFASAIRRIELNDEAGCNIQTAYALAVAFGTTIDKMLQEGGLTYG